MSKITVMNRQGEPVQVQRGKRCPVCKYHVRGVHHDTGSHHKKGRP